MSRLSTLFIVSVLGMPNLVLADDAAAKSNVTRVTSNSAPASVISLRNSQISAEIAANVEHIHVDVGDRVKKGDKLVDLDCREYDANLEQSKADIETVKAQLLTANAVLETRISDIEASKANEELMKAQASAERSRISMAKSKFNAAKSRVKADNAKCQLANIELQRSRNLRQQRLISQQELDTALTEYQVARAECSAVESALVGVQSDIGTAQATADAAEAMIKAQQSKTLAARSNLKAAKTNIIAVEARLSAAKAQHKTQALIASRCNISSPFDGQIVQRLVQPGQRISAGEKAFQLLSISDAEVTATLSKVELDSLKQAKKIYFNAANKQFVITLRSIIATVTGQARAQEVRFEFENTLPIGQNGRISW